MFCNKCGFQLPNDAWFCPKCGNPVSVQSQASSGVSDLAHRPWEEFLNQNERALYSLMRGGFELPARIYRDIGIDSLVITNQRLYFFEDRAPAIGGLLVDKENYPPNPVIYDTDYARNVMTGLEQRYREERKEFLKRYKRILRGKSGKPSELRKHLKAGEEEDWLLYIHYHQRQMVFFLTGLNQYGQTLELSIFRFMPEKAAFVQQRHNSKLDLRIVIDSERAGVVQTVSSDAEKIRRYVESPQFDVDFHQRT